MKIGHSFTHSTNNSIVCVESLWLQDTSLHPHPRKRALIPVVVRDIETNNYAIESCTIEWIKVDCEIYF